MEPILIWELEDGPDGNYVHIVVEHGITQDEVWDVLSNRANPTVQSDSSGRPATFAWTQTGRYLLVIFELVDEDPRALNPVTAYDVEPPKSWRWSEIMSQRHVTRKAERTPEQAAQLRADRERYRHEKPTPEQLLAEGGHTEFIPLGQFLELRQLFKRLKQVREEKKVTLAELEELTGIDQAALSRIENGRNLNPTVDTLFRIASALGQVIYCTCQEAPAAPKRRDARRPVAMAEK